MGFSPGQAPPGTYGSPRPNPNDPNNPLAPTYPRLPGAPGGPPPPAYTPNPPVTPTTIPLVPGGTYFGDPSLTPKPADAPAKAPDAAWTAPWTGTPGTGSYAVPKYTASNFGTAPSGWDSASWLDPQHQTPKYVVGRIYQSGQMAGKGLDTIVADIQRAYPGTTWNGKDVITVPGIGPVDFVRDFGGANGISWNPLTGQPAAPTPTAAASSLAAPATDVTSLTAPTMATTSSYDPNADPFAAIGGGVQLPGGGWVPAGHPLAQGIAGQAPAPTPEAAATVAAPTNVDPFASMGGGVQLPGGGWVPRGHPLAQGVATPSSGTTDPQTAALRQQALLSALGG